MTKDMTDKERMDYYNNRGREVQRMLERMKAANVQQTKKNCICEESGKGSFEDTVLKAAAAKAVKNAEQLCCMELFGKDGLGENSK